MSNLAPENEHAMISDVINLATVHSSLPLSLPRV
jgi:hypothetical protein